LSHSPTSPSAVSPPTGQTYTPTVGRDSRDPLNTPHDLTQFYRIGLPYEFPEDPYIIHPNAFDQDPASLT
jgi:hypothetical protein